MMKSLFGGFLPSKSPPTQHEEALELFRKLLHILERLGEEQKTPNSYLDLSAAYEKVGSIYKAQGKLFEALTMQEKSLGISKRLDEELNTPESRYDLAVGYRKTREIYNALGRHEEAQAMHEKFLHLKKLTEQKKTTHQCVRFI